MPNLIPHLHIDRHGTALWDDVPVGEYRIVTIQSGPSKGKDVLIQKEKDGSATVHLHPESMKKSLSFSFPKIKKSVGAVSPEELPEPIMPTQYVHGNSMDGSPRYVPVHSKELHPDGYPIGAKLPAGHVRTQNGYVHTLPMDEFSHAQNGHGQYPRYKSLGLPDAANRNGIGDHSVPYQDYRSLQDMDGKSIHEHIDNLLHQNGAQNGAMASPTGDWYHAHGNNITLPSDVNGERKDVSKHIASAIVDPAEVWEHNGENGGPKTRTHVIYPVHENEGEERRFPYGIHLHAEASHLSADKDEPNHWNVTSVHVPTQEDANEGREGRPVYIRTKHGDE